MAKHSVGGKARRIASESVGSSPAVSIKETRISVLKRMLRERDRQLSCGNYYYLKKHFPHFVKKEDKIMDEERRVIRERIKELSSGRKTG